MREKGKEEAEEGKIKTALAVSTHRPIQQTAPPLPPRMDGQLLVTHREEEEGKERERKEEEERYGEREERSSLEREGRTSVRSNGDFKWRKTLPT